MEDIINKIILQKDDMTYEQIELEINLKIECEKTKQLELIKDIRKIEKSIKEKELYCKQKNNIDSDSEYSDSYSESDYDSDYDSDYESELNYESIKSVKIKNLSNKNNYDNISMCSIDSEYDVDKEINILY